MVKAGQRIKNYLQVNDITESELSQRTGFSEKRINSMLTGKGRISIDDMDRICKALETDPQSILDGRPDNKVFHELVTLAMDLSIENQRHALSFIKGLAKNPGYYVSNYRHEAIKRLVMANIPTSEENVQAYLDESAKYTETLKKGTAKIEKYPLIYRVKQAIDESRKAPVEV
jgi:DNA-binding Xre family transcriptional regulator